MTTADLRGSFMGPLLFIIYTNDAKNQLQHSQTVESADDMTIYISDKNINNLYDNINIDLYCIADWLKANPL